MQTSLENFFYVIPSKHFASYNLNCLNKSTKKYGTSDSLYFYVMTIQVSELSAPSVFMLWALQACPAMNFFKCNIPWQFK
jgi:hypothetical protein